MARDAAFSLTLSGKRGATLAAIRTASGRAQLDLPKTTPGAKGAARVAVRGQPADVLKCLAEIKRHVPDLADECDTAQLTLSYTADDDAHKPTPN